MSTEPITTEPPVIECERMYCKRYHTHGKDEGHRMAHCQRWSPYIRSGYVLKLKPPENSPDNSKRSKRVDAMR